MKKLSVTEIENLSINDVKNMSDIYEFSSVVTMGYFIKKLQIANKSYVADYKDKNITLK